MPDTGEPVTDLGLTADGPGGVSPTVAPRPLRTARSRRRVLGVAVAALLAVAAAGADRALAHRELDGLLDRVRTGTESVTYADRRIAATVTYAGPALRSAAVAPRVRDSLAGIVAQTAAGTLPDLRDQRARAAATRVLPWHSRARRARAAWVAYLDAQLAYLAGVARDVDEIGRPHPGLGADLDAARQAYLAAARPLGATPRTAAAFSDR